MNKKQIAGQKAAEWIKDGMKVGLGTGSTVYYTILELGERLKKEGLQIEAIPTSKETEKLAQSLGIPLTTFADVTRLDVVIDGADAVTPTYDLIKGGGGALLREKLVAKSSDTFIVVVDDSKQVNDFEGLPIPIEIVPFAFQTTLQRISTFSSELALRMKKPNAVGAVNAVNEPFVTDNGNYVVDAKFAHMDSIGSPAKLHEKLKSLTGVVETGLFTGMADIVVVGCDEGAKVFRKGKAD